MPNGASQFMIEPGAGEAFDEKRHMGRVGGALWILGGAVTLAGTFLPGAEHKQVGWVLALIALVVAYGIGSFTGWIPWPSRRALAIATGLTTPVIGLAIYVTGGAISYVEPLLVCSLLYSALFFPPRWAWPLVIELVLVALAPAVYEDGAADFAFLSRWLARAGAFLTLTWVIIGLKQRLVDAEARQREIANRDPLTGIANRRAFDTALRAQLESRIKPQGGRRDVDREPLALFIVDFDDFKGINDDYGHQIGDTILRQSAERVQAVLRSTDMLARIGGDEFAVIAPGAQGEGAEGLAGAMREAIAVKEEGSPIPEPRASVGVATFPEDGETFEELMRAADQRLLRLKSNGSHFSSRNKSLRLI